ncbi:MAG: hypothetical protein KGO81_01250 [Bacteroidota bacterium]|nr:hypothetical protein [Bacteroidota bacterium]
MTTQNMLKPSIRLRRIQDGSLRIHDLNRNLIFIVTPNQEKEKDSEGYSVILKSFTSKLSVQDLFKLAKRLEEDDLDNVHYWSKNWEYLYALERMN